MKKIIVYFLYAPAYLLFQIYIIFNQQSRGRRGRSSLLTEHLSNLTADDKTGDKQNNFERESIRTNGVAP